MFEDKHDEQPAAGAYLHPPTLDSVAPTWTLPPGWSEGDDAPCHAWLPELLRRGWQIGPAEQLPRYFTARRVFGSPVALGSAGVAAALIATATGESGAGVTGAAIAFAVSMAVYVLAHLLWAVITRPSREVRAAPPRVLQVHARDAQEYTPPPSSPEGRRLVATVKAIRHIQGSPAWRSSLLQDWSARLEFDLVEEWSEIRYRVGHICQVRVRIDRAPNMPAPIREKLNAKIDTILTATDLRVGALVEYSAQLRRVETCLRALHNGRIGESLGAELDELLIRTAGDAHLAEGTRSTTLDLEATEAILRSALQAMCEQADLLRTHDASTEVS